MLSILQSPASLRNVLQFPAFELRNNVVYIFGFALNRCLARSAAERAVAGTFALVVIERNGRDFFALDVFPDVKLGPIKKRMNPDMCARGIVGLKLIPEFRRLISNVPKVVFVAGRK